MYTGRHTHTRARPQATIRNGGSEHISFGHVLRFEWGCSWMLSMVIFRVMVNGVECMFDKL